MKYLKSLWCVKLLIVIGLVAAWSFFSQSFAKGNPGSSAASYSKDRRELADPESDPLKNVQDGHRLLIGENMMGKIKGPSRSAGAGSLVLLGHWTVGPCLAVAAKGDTAYCGFSEYFEVIDVSNTASPNPIGHLVLPQYIEGITVSGNHAYVADGEYGLRIIDISDPASPYEVGYYDSWFWASGVDVSGDYAYVAGVSHGLYVIDVSDPANPFAVGSYNTSNYARDVAVSGNYAYVADGDSGLVVIDVTSPLNLVEVGSANTPGGHAWSIVVRGIYAYVADGGNGLRIIDISQPTNPVDVGDFSFPGGYAWDVTVRLNYAYVAFGDDGLFKITIYDPTLPLSVGFIDTFDAKDVAINGSDAYLADGSGGLRVLDVFSSPVELGNFDMSDEVNKVAIKGSYAYVADGKNGLGVINVSDSTSPVHVGYYNTPDNAYDVAVAGSYAYVADWGGGLRVIDISNPTNPFEAGYYHTAGNATSVAVSGSYAYMTTYQGGGLYVIDVSNPANPVETGYYATAGWGITITGSHAYVANHSGAPTIRGLRVIDVSNPASPSEVGSYDTPGYAQDVAISGSLAYVADDWEGLRILDVTDPTNPFEVGFYDTQWNAYSVLVAGDYAYVADWSDGLIVIDISNPTSPVEVGNFSENTWDQAYGVAYSWGTVYLADASYGLYILQNTLLSSVLITNFEAHLIDDGVRLTWEVSADEALRGFRLYREEMGSGASTYLPKQGLLSIEAKSFVDREVRGGEKYHYTLAAVKADGSEVISQRITVETKVKNLALYQNYPNPFNPSTTISYTLHETAHVNLAVYDLRGKLVRILVDQKLDQGLKETAWDGMDAQGDPVSSGVYFYRLRAGKKVLTKKMLLVK